MELCTGNCESTDSLGVGVDLSGPDAVGDVADGVADASSVLDLFGRFGIRGTLESELLTLLGLLGTIGSTGSSIVVSNRMIKFGSYTTITNALILLARHVPLISKSSGGVVRSRDVERNGELYRSL